ncbi:MAG: tRNA (adenosine(37)-N6)-dimethylallyltransferase MiaA [Bacteroidales bacterium]|nr:tRNA (adenosine(37)-N6)-dimethylallyltransferase MiaA [Bacteroidales bacterium]MBN2750691.1 tRNA (adenosine(37)-N6)-dimethylallyltransferase MiaA [Bacteroidales bacterium]
MPDNRYELITILGPTAVGKTAVAANLALAIDGEIISADSRQVYRGMDIGTGKDLADYTINSICIPYHLIDIADAGDKYNVFRFQSDFLSAYNHIRHLGKQPILCGGTGMYIEAVTKGYKMVSVPVNEPLRAELDAKSDEELEQMLRSLKQVHNRSDFDTRKRTIRAIEIELHQQSSGHSFTFPSINNIYFGIAVDREIRRNRITQRLKDRLREGMIEEVQGLISAGVPVSTLIFYGLEYKFVAMYLVGELTYNDMFSQLNAAIHQFAKRQMTWFRKMERSGDTIHWIDGTLPMDEKINQIMSTIQQYR